ncbi:UDP-N-acetylmuramoyl-L-alanyl-D-glutamate--2,6-diaminopimelate ligase [Aliibacillus thermotolerans]|uniref:UDP-N-acetylmuramoyl-L-alanyl-D-glutamate--2,6-diaminopimelate ligase n=1 Tax=Aliibacillus thermotolerans TaxID=1834418 RepID=A0ABW0U5A2_9BACI
MTLHELTEQLLVKTVTKPHNPTVTSLVMDSREVTEGSLFFCVKGYRVDGHDFAKEAEQHGAVAIVAERMVDVDIPVVLVRDVKRAMAILSAYFYHHPSEKLRVIGITGTNGKTTTSHLIESILQQNNKKTGLIGTLYTKIGSDRFETKNTTPESILLQQTFAEMIKKEIEYCIMEVSSHALDLGRVRGVSFDTAVFTNLSKDHLDYHETMEAYTQAKGLLFAQLGNTYDERKMVILNGDDPTSSYFEKMSAHQILTYGIERGNDIEARQLEMTPFGSNFQLVTPWGEKQVHYPLAGKFNVYNALAAASVGLVEGVSLTNIVSALEQAESVDGRFQPVDVGQSFAVIVDYAHTPDSLENVLSTIQMMTEGNIYTVVGCGGDRDKTKRPEMASIATKYSNYAIFTSDNPRTEDPEKILQDMVTGVRGETNYTVLVNRKEAIKEAIGKARRGDVVLIAGKGHETYQIIGHQTFPFDDRVEAEKAIKALKKMEKDD